MNNEERWEEPPLPPPIIIAGEVPVVGWVIASLGFAFLLIELHKLGLF